MYYDKYRSQIIVDPIDLYLLMAILSILVTKFVQSYFSEEKKMERLRRDIIRQSNRLKSPSPVTVKDTSVTTRVRLMNPSTLSIRGGNIEHLTNRKLLTKSTGKIKQWINWLWFMLYDPLTRGKSNLILDLLRFNLLSLLRMWGLNLQAVGILQISLINLLPSLVCAIVTGPIVVLLGVGTTLALEFFMAILVGKSVMQQIIHNSLSRKYKSKIVDVMHETLTEESELKNKISKIMEKIKKIAVEEPNIEPSNWNIDPAIERTAEPFAIVNDMVKESSVSEIINESTIGEIVKESNSSSTLAERVKARGRKTRYQTMQGLLNKLKKGEQIYDEYEEYMQPIRRVPPIKVQ
jgi:hypothetical protein